jgi:hypothetical protein
MKDFNPTREFRKTQGLFFPVFIGIRVALISAFLLGGLWLHRWSPWQGAFISPLYSALYCFLAAGIISWIGSLKIRRIISWNSLFQAVVLFVFFQTALEMAALPPQSLRWQSAYGLFILIGIGTSIILAFARRGGSLYTHTVHWLVRIRSLLGVGRWLFLLLILAFPAWLCLDTIFGSMVTGIYHRLALLVICSAVAGYLLTTGVHDLVRKEALLVGIGAVAFVFIAGINLQSVVNYPFSLTWSEGNRFYDYSLVFGKSLYDYAGELTLNYSAPGRYGLWGIWFIIPGLPIWFHRLWNAVLWVAAPLVLSLLLVRSVQGNRLLKIGLALWMTLFLQQGPIYPSLIVALIIMGIFYKKNIWLRGISTAVSSWYAGISRFTWALVPGVWAAIIDLEFFYPQRKGSWFKRLLPTGLLALAGVLPGTFAAWGGLILKLLGIDKSVSFVLSQPLLWYRLLPNPTNSLGIIISLLLAGLFLVIILLWLAIRRRWVLNFWQIIVYMGAFSGFLVVGLIASTKIGGGSNLHNLDMFLVTVGLLALLAFRKVTQENYQWEQIHPVMRLLLVFVVIYASWNAVMVGQPMTLPNQQDVDKALTVISQEVKASSAQGEVLFLDERQLLTFGYIRDVPFVPEYEKKYMMDQAMADNAAYFETFNNDIKNHRFKLIVSEPLRIVQRGSEYVFGEENDAWVKWVSTELLKYYEQKIYLKKVNVVLLVPKE